ncbi:MAG: hypothetical protein KGJ02_03555 [Verrucomicrobiota bacterium]|nr:hypothetical protein [Verrucomicrobiota bacterium]
MSHIKRPTSSSDVTFAYMQNSQQGSGLVLGSSDKRVNKTALNSFSAFQGNSAVGSMKMRAMPCGVIVGCTHNDRGPITNADIGEHIGNGQFGSAARDFLEKAAQEKRSFPEKVTPSNFDKWSQHTKDQSKKGGDDSGCVIL